MANFLKKTAKLPIYLDYNATTPLISEVKKTIIESLEHFGNPSSSYVFGEVAHELVEKARGQVSHVL